MFLIIKYEIIQRIKNIMLSLYDQRMKKFSRDFSWVFAAKVGIIGIGFAQVAIVGRFLKPEGYGLLYLIIAYVSTVNQFFSFRTTEMSTKYIAGFWMKGDKPRTLAVAKLSYLLDLSTNGLAFIFVILTSSIAAKYIIHLTEATGLIQLYSLTLLFTAVTPTSSVILVVFDKFSWLSIQSILLTCIRFILVISALLAGWALKGVLIANILAEIVSAISRAWLAWEIIKKELWGVKNEAPLRILKDKFKEMGTFLGSTYVHATMGFISKDTDMMFLGYFRNPTESGYYALAKRFASALGEIDDPLYTVVYPELAKIWSGNNRAQFKRVVGQISSVIAIILSPLVLGLLLAAPLLIKFIVGEEFLPAAMALRILLVGITVAVVLTWNRAALYSMGKAHLVMMTSIIVAICHIVLSMALVPTLGYVGSAIVLTTIYIIGNGMFLLLSLKTLQMDKNNMSSRL